MRHVAVSNVIIWCHRLKNKHKCSPLIVLVINKYMRKMIVLRVKNWCLFLEHAMPFG